MVLAHGTLWVTGRKADLYRVDPDDGSVQAKVEVGAGGIDLVAAKGSIWIAAPTAEDDRRGNPFLERLLRVEPATNAVVSVLRPRRRTVVDGFAHDGEHAWLVDVVSGRLLRLDG